MFQCSVMVTCLRIIALEFSFLFPNSSYISKLYCSTFEANSSILGPICFYFLKILGKVYKSGFLKFWIFGLENTLQKFKGKQWKFKCEFGKDLAQIWSHSKVHFIFIFQEKMFHEIEGLCQRLYWWTEVKPLFFSLWNHTTVRRKFWPFITKL